ncbi:hypothetical protein PI125_g18562, partial [Phytophthora idaei]
MKLPAPLTSAIVVSRSHLDIAALPHIAETISAFLDCSVHWSLPAACGFAFQDGALRLVQRVTAHQAIDDRRSEEFLHQHPKFRTSKSKIQRSEAILVLRQKEDPFYRQKLFTLGMARAAARGDLSVMQWLVREFPGCYVTLAVEEAAKHGHLKVLQWLHRNSRVGHIRDEGGGRNDTGLDVFWGAKELFYAGLNGHLRVVQWLQEHTNPTPTHMFFVTLEEAAKNGDLPMVKWLCNVRGEWSPYAGILAASGGHLDVLKWLKNNIFSSSPSASMDDAAANGHLHVLKWLQVNSGYATHAAMNKAAGNGHLEIVKWLQNTRREGCTTVAMDRAAANGYFDIVKWLHSNRTEGCTKAAMDEAATHGHLNIVQWLQINRKEGCTMRAMDGAAMNGHLEVVQWLHQNRKEGCTTAAMDGAARANHLKVVEWLQTNRKEGCTLA